MADQNQVKAPENRGNFSSNLGFILAAAGSAIGLGNLWKFPYLTGQYGGAVFILTYLFFTLIFGIPLILGETIIGKYTHKSAVPAYQQIALERNAKGAKAWGAVGFMGVIAEVMMYGYYCVVGGWIIKYLAMAIFTGLPDASVAQETFSSFTASPVEPLIWMLAFIGLTLLIVLRGIKDGIEKIGKIMMPTLFILLIIIVIRSLTLPGAMEGVVWMLKPDMSKFNSEMILAALGQTFFSLSLGAGATIVYGSYLQKKENVLSSAYGVCGMSTLNALLCGFAILPAVFSFGLEPGQGPGLLFVSIPSIMNSFGPILGRLFGIMFFVMVIFAGITTSVAMLEIPAAWLIDSHGWSRKKAACVITGIVVVLGVFCSFALGIWSDKLIFGYNFFDLLDAISAKILMPLGGLLMSLFIGYIWKPERALEEISNGGTVKFGWFKVWKLLLMVINPILIIVVFLSGFGLF